MKKKRVEILSQIDHLKQKETSLEGKTNLPEGENQRKLMIEYFEKDK